MTNILRRPFTLTSTPTVTLVLISPNGACLDSRRIARVPRETRRTCKLHTQKPLAPRGPGTFTMPPPCECVPDFNIVNKRDRTLPQFMQHLITEGGRHVASSCRDAITVRISADKGSLAYRTGDLVSSTFTHRCYASIVHKCSGKNTEDCNIKKLSVMVPP